MTLLFGIFLGWSIGGAICLVAGMVIGANSRIRTEKAAGAGDEIVAVIKATVAECAAKDKKPQQAKPGRI